MPAVPIEITEVLPTQVLRRGDVLFADFGKDVFGKLQITFLNDPQAAELTVRLGEKLSADGTIDRKPNGSVCYRETKLATSPGERTYCPDMPLVKRHNEPPAVDRPAGIGEIMPLRYAEIEGPTLAKDQITLRQLFVHAPFNDSAGSFECSDETINAVWKLCHHTMKATTAFGIYIDGERERIAYEADAYINQLSHYACDLDPRVARATFEWLLKYPTWPIEWSHHMPLIAAADYWATGDPILAKTHFDALTNKLLMNLAGDDGLLKAFAIVDWPVDERDGFNHGERATHDKRVIGPEINSVVNAFYFYALRQMAKLARAIGRDADAAEFDQRASRVATAYQKAFFDPQRRLYIDGLGCDHTSLHANMFPLAFGLVPPEHQAAVADFVESRGMACSVYGAQYLLEALFTAGRADSAIKLLAGRGVRSWWNMIAVGSTMTLEAWDAQFKPNLTWNHAWGAVPANILSRFVLGVRPMTPGYQKILIAPQPGPLQHARGQVPTPHGPVTVSIENAHPLRLDITLPAGTTAVVKLPRPCDGQVVLNGQPIQAPAKCGAIIVEPSEG